MNKNKKNNKNQASKAKAMKIVFPNRAEIPYLAHGVGGHPARRIKGEPAVKVVDANLIVATPSTTPILFNLFAPTQGPALNQRTGDITFIDRMWITYTCNAANADVFSSLRLILFQWKPNDLSQPPTAAVILQSVADNVYAMYDWNFSDQYRILFDRIHSFSGTLTNPTSSTNQCISQEISLAPCVKRVEFGFGLPTGDNVIFLMVMSDSAIAPFPNLNFKSRITYTDS